MHARCVHRALASPRTKLTPPSLLLSLALSLSRTQVVLDQRASGARARAACVAAPRPGTVLVDMTTSQPSLAMEIAESARSQGVWAVDAPVSGGDVGAREAGRGELHKPRRANVHMWSVY